MSDKHMAGYKEYIDNLKDKSTQIVKEYDKVVKKYTYSNQEYRDLMEMIINELKGLRDER